MVNGVNIWRPLLQFDKATIFDFAHRYGIPYFKDTTPHWSTRGHLRNKLLPLLSSMYGEGFLRHLSHLAAQSEQLSVLTHSTLFEPFWASVEYNALGAIVDCNAVRTRPLFFWKESLKHIAHQMGVGTHGKSFEVCRSNRSLDTEVFALAFGRNGPGEIGSNVFDTT